MTAAPRDLVVSLHDVAPVHLARLRAAESLLRRLGIERVQYLLVPQFHGSYPADEDPAFVAWCAEPRTFAVDWWLHGFYHEERGPAETASLDRRDRWRQRWLTAGEGEFLTLAPEVQRRRIRDGCEVFARCLGGRRPAGFVAPAWLFQPGLLAVLRECSLALTEDHHRFYDVQRGLTLPAPVITWATRTLGRKYGSLVVCPARTLWFHSAPVLRVALHPHDFDHPETRANLEIVLRLLRRRRTSLPAQLDWDNLATPIAIPTQG